MKSLKHIHTAKRIFIYVAAVLGILWSCFPIYWMIKSSLTPNDEMYELHPSLVPSRLTLDHYKQLFTQSKLRMALFHSLPKALS